MMSWIKLVFAILFLLIQDSNHINITRSARNRGMGKFLNVFSVVRFSNERCQGTINGANARNGTCYTEKECRTKNGVAEGPCAGGFGVCCVFSIGCGGTTYENITYISTDLSSSRCTYTICRCSPTVTQLRLDFQEFQLAAPFTCGGSSSKIACGTTDGPLIGDCLYDTFTVTTPGGPAPPVICGYNTGHHMYLDASERCNKLNFDMELGKSTRRIWEIQVLQYEAGEDMRYMAPPDCLQYYTGTLGTVRNFNYVDKDGYHLSSQRYNICWRRERGYCALCLSIAPRTGAFGLSNVPSLVPNSPTSSTHNRKAGYTDSICCSRDSPTANCASSGANDFIEFNGAQEPPAQVGTVGSGNRFCGRWMGITTDNYDAGNIKTICTVVTPFRMAVHFSPGEKLATTSAGVCASSGSNGRKGDYTDECSSFRTYGFSKGTTGFFLTYNQIKCT